MVIRFVAMRDFLLPEFSQQLPVSVVNRTGRRRLLLKNPAHVVQQTCHGISQQGRRMFVILLPCRCSLWCWRSMVLLQLSAKPHRLLNHNILDAFELLLPRERDVLRQIVLICPQDLLPHLVPEIVSGGDTLVPLQLIHDLIHQRFQRRFEIAILFLAGSVPELPR